MDYDDGATTLLLYVDGDPEGYPKELVQLLAYMKNSIPKMFVTRILRRFTLVLIK